MSVSEQSGEGPGNGGIVRSEKMLNAEQSGEGPGDGGIARSANRKTVTGKRKMQSIETKYAALLEVEKGIKTKADIARQYGIPSNTLSSWIKKSESIKSGFLKFGPNRKKMRTGSFEEIERALLKWFKTARSSNLPVSGPFLVSKAQEFAQKLGEPEFSASCGWLDRFKERHGITFKKICGEAKAVDESSNQMDEWKLKLETVLRQYSPDDIYNADETGLFFRLLPDKTMEFKGTDCHGGKQSKERLTAMVCANMSGSHKIPILTIGKSAKPRCFKNIQTLPVDYVANKKAWMTSEIFTNWLLKLDKKFTRQGRRIAMIIDNCPAHPHVPGLKAIELLFLPPNTTSKTQPMDQGIIKSLKDHYKRKVIFRHLQAIDNQSTLSLNVLDALRLLRDAWMSVTTRTIVNCFRHAGFLRTDNPEPLDDEDDPEDDIPLAQLAALGPNTDLDAFINADNALPTSEELTDDDIISDIIGSRTSTTDAEEEDDDSQETESQPITRSTIQSALAGCMEARRVMETVDTPDDVYSGVCRAINFLTKEDMKLRCGKQSLLTDFLVTKP